MKLKKRKIIYPLVILTLLFSNINIFMVFSNAEDTSKYTIPEVEGIDNRLDLNNITEAKNKAWSLYLDKIKNDTIRRSEFNNRELSFGQVKMKFTLERIGSKIGRGYPLYIALHGGGETNKNLNDSQWIDMQSYYKNGIKNGIYIAPRGVRDTWDTHFNPESFPLYDRLIEDAIAFEEVDPDKVYILGFSAGGDGVYGITTRMTDRFAAANMSAGHHNNVSLLNLFNMPIFLQVGENDVNFNRNKETAKYGKLLENHKIEYNGGYVNKVYIHKDKGHNFGDNTFLPQNIISDYIKWLDANDSSTIQDNTNAITAVSSFYRVAYPQKVVWDLSTRASLRSIDANYWLRVNKSVSKGKIVASYDKNINMISIESTDLNDTLTILINNSMLDLTKKISVQIDGQSLTYQPNPTLRRLLETTFERGDYIFQFEDAIILNKVNGKWSFPQKEMTGKRILSGANSSDLTENGSNSLQPIDATSNIGKDSNASNTDNTDIIPKLEGRSQDLGGDFDSPNQEGNKGIFQSIFQFIGKVFNFLKKVVKVS
jgi:predicted esterase